jgi:hypothetical protein
MNVLLKRVLLLFSQSASITCCPLGMCLSGLRTAASMTLLLSPQTDPTSSSSGSSPRAMMMAQQQQHSPDTIEERLLELTNASNYSIVQRNGQRIYGGPPPGWEGEAPERGCEVFVGKVPRDVFEDEIVPIFSMVSSRDLTTTN